MLDKKNILSCVALAKRTHWRIFLISSVIVRDSAGRKLVDLPSLKIFLKVVSLVCYRN